MIQGQNTTTISYTDNELDFLMDEMYEKLDKEGLENREIKKKMASMEPFKNNINQLIQFFDKKQENKYD